MSSSTGVSASVHRSQRLTASCAEARWNVEVALDPPPGRADTTARRLLQLADYRSRANADDKQQRTAMPAMADSHCYFKYINLKQAAPIAQHTTATACAANATVIGACLQHATRYRMCCRGHGAHYRMHCRRKPQFSTGSVQSPPKLAPLSHQTRPVLGPRDSLSTARCASP
jgi:hypothetical protein